MLYHDGLDGDAACVTCGVALNTVSVEYKLHGCSECGDSTDIRREYASGQNAWMMTADKQTFGALFNKNLERILAQQKADLEKEISATVSRKDFRAIVWEKRLAELNAPYEAHIRELDNLLVTFYSGTADYWPKRDLPYAIHAECISPFLQTGRVEKTKYTVNRVEGRKEETMHEMELHIAAAQVPAMLKHFFSQFAKQVNPHDFETDDRLTFRLSSI